jgi:glyoxylate reductase
MDIVNTIDKEIHLFGAAEFKKMKPTAYLINGARGKLIDTKALYDALKNGDIAFAALDVPHPEPLPGLRNS